MGRTRRSGRMLMLAATVALVVAVPAASSLALAQPSSGGGEKRLTKKQKCKKKNKRDIRLGHNYRHRFINGKCVKVPLDNGTTPPTTPPNSCNPYGSPGYLPCKLTTNITFTSCPPSGGSASNPTTITGLVSPDAGGTVIQFRYPEDNVIKSTTLFTAPNGSFSFTWAPRTVSILNVNADFSGDAVRNPAGAVSCQWQPTSP